MLDINSYHLDQSKFDDSNTILMYRIYGNSTEEIDVIYKHAVDPVCKIVSNQFSILLDVEQTLHLDNEGLYLECIIKLQTELPRNIVVLIRFFTHGIMIGYSLSKNNNFFFEGGE